MFCCTENLIRQILQHLVGTHVYNHFISSHNTYNNYMQESSEQKVFNNWQQVTFYNFHLFTWNFSNFRNLGATQQRLCLENTNWYCMSTCHTSAKSCVAMISWRIKLLHFTHVWPGLKKQVYLHKNFHPILEYCIFLIKTQ